MVYSTTDAAAANPLLKDFATLYPGVKVDYTDMNSTELYSRFIAEVASGSGTADVLWSSAMDLQVKLAADGNAATYASPEIASAAEMGGVAQPGLRHDLRADHVRLQQAPGAGRRRAAGPSRAARTCSTPRAPPSRTRSPPMIRRNPASAICSSTRTSRTSRRPGTCSGRSARPASSSTPRPAP